MLSYSYGVWLPDAIGLPAHTTATRKYGCAGSVEASLSDACKEWLHADSDDVMCCS